MSSHHLSVCRYVDMWAFPGMHPTNIELLQQLKTADTHRFTKNMDVVGTVSEKDLESGQWEKTHLVGIRTDTWRPTAQEMARSLRVLKKKRYQELKQRLKRYGRLNSNQADKLDDRLDEDDVMQTQANELERRRLVLKLFKTTGKSLRWCGTLEEMTTSEIHNSMGSKRSLLTMVAMLPNTEFVTYVQQNHRTFRIPSIFTCCYYDQKQMWHLTLKRRWISIGADFDMEVDGEPLGVLDGRLIALGADSYIKLKDHPLAGNTPFIDLITLFSASVGYHRAMRRAVRRRVDATKLGESHRHIIETEELRLHHNGRAAA